MSKQEAKQLFDLLVNGGVEPDDMPKLFKYFENPDAPFVAYWDVFTAYVRKTPNYELGMILEKFPHLPHSWRGIIERKIGVKKMPGPEEKMKREDVIRHLRDRAHEFKVKMGPRDPGLN